MELKQLIAEWICSSRAAAGLSGAALAAKLTLQLGDSHSKATISHWETKKHQPNLVQLLAIAEITKKSFPDELLSLMKFGDDPGADAMHQDAHLDGMGPDSVSIPQYREVAGSMGHGIILRDQPGEIQAWGVTPDWLQKNVRSHSGVNNLAIVTGFGDSMRGMFNPGDPLLVDRGIKTFDGDAVYFFRVADEGFIKRLQRIPGEGIIASSENKAYRDWLIKPEMDFEVLARVLKVWQSVDF